ncbi:MFS transporter [Sphingobacterium bovistauri]|uniref:MFS transporter n=1 Tax=Sphingobacterium bovistauri TaxID=2781959 RepID=A0ABS7Z8H2_9SPHI|nr:MFS transporter [Sphingobacterium bovistauri]MCA5006503.1 MFS transporter [Sphingobacterium bovistauri]
MPNKQPKTNFQIISLCTGFLGIQIGFALQAGNVTRVLQNFGADLTEVSLLWLIAPISGALVQPIIGYLSDRNMNTGNTRIPYLLFGGLICALCLYLLPNAGVIVSIGTPLLTGALLLIVIDTSFNVSMHPLRAAISDYLPTYQQPRGFAIQTFMISLGAILGSTLPYVLHHFFGFAEIADENQIPENVKWSFYIGSTLLLICILITSKAISNNKQEARIRNTTDEGINTVQLQSIPSKMWQLGLIQFFSWAAFFFIWIFMTPAISQHIFKEYNFSSSSIAYAKAANYTGILFGLYHLSASIFALALTYLYKRLNIIKTHTLALLIGGIGFIMIYFSSSIIDLYLPMICIGIAWSSILASPFALLSRIIPQQKIGFYFGIFNLFITIPQIIVGFFGGFIIENYFESEAIFAVIIAGISLLLASLTCFFFRKSLQL